MNKLFTSGLFLVLWPSVTTACDRGSRNGALVGPIGCFHYSFPCFRDRNGHASTVVLDSVKFVLAFLIILKKKITVCMCEESGEAVVNKSTSGREWGEGT